MPELKDKTVEFDEVDVDVEKLVYKDKNREKQRKRKIQEQQESGENISQTRAKQKKFGRVSVPWSKNKERKEKREKRKARREFLRKQRHKHLFDEDELVDLAREANLVKKLKSGKLSKEEFDSRIGNEEEEGV